MRISVGDICRKMEQWAPPGLSYDWDKAGLAIGAPNDRVERVLVCLTVNRTVFAEAQRCGAQLVLSHHPLIWTPFKALRTDHPHTRLCLDFAEAGIACYSAHTNLDIAPQGVNAVLAHRLGLIKQSVLFSAAHAAAQVKLVTFVPQSHATLLRDALAEAGAGTIGAYTHCAFTVAGTGSFRPEAEATPYVGDKGVINEEPEQRLEMLAPKARLSHVLKALFKNHPYEEVAYDVIPLENRDANIGMGIRGELREPCSLAQYAAYVKQQLHLDHVCVVGDTQKELRRVAVMGGAGGGEVRSLPPDIDVFVTGDVKYHDACEAMERGFTIIDAGHRGTELPIVPAMVDYLKQAFSTLEVKSYMEPALFSIQ